jgi:drug/metabolite transporter (DMT)-like permease
LSVPTGPDPNSQAERAASRRRAKSGGPAFPDRDPRNSLAARRGYLHLLVVYGVWGSTFLAIRIAVSENGGFPPFTLSALRTLSGALLLFAIVAATGSVRVPRGAIPGLASSGILLFAIGHAALLFGAQRAPSGYAAVLFGATPLFGLLADSLLRRAWPGRFTLIATLCGFAGVAVLGAPSLGGADLDGITIGCLVAAPIGWALGSTLVTPAAKAVPALASAAYQQLFGGLACAAVALALERPGFDVDPRAWLALAYLVVPGCVPAFTSYVRALQLLPPSAVMTFAYVNPVIAMALGWWLLDEAITPVMLAGTLLLLAGVAGIARASR